MTECKCGCGEEVSGSKYYSAVYVNGHNSRGMIFSQEQKERISKSLHLAYRSGNKKAAWTGKNFSEDHKKKISEGTKKNQPRTIFKKGNEPWNKGRTGVWNEKQLESNRQKHIGRLASEETKKKLKITRAKQVMPLKDTSIEVKIQEFLKELKIEYVTHKYIESAKHQCDIFIPSLNMIIECDGIYWHKYPLGKEEDIIQTELMKEAGYRVIRLWETEIKNMGLKEFANIIGVI